MIYFDNAATTFPKPQCVVNTMVKALTQYGANPGRSGHMLSMNTAEAVYNARKRCADFFGGEVENTIFTNNCTQALNMSIKGIATDGCHIITTDIEHNAVMRPLYALSKEITIVKTGTNAQTISNIANAITTKTTLVVMTGASNVTGRILPYKEVGKICKEKGICLIVDAAQIAGILPITLADNVNIICTAGHKGLYGPMGTGLMVTDGKYTLKTIIEGGTGSVSSELEQPSFSPDRFESGTINTPGAIALGEGVRFVTRNTVAKIYNDEWSLCKYLYDNLKCNNNIKLYTENYTKEYVPLISFNFKNVPSEKGVALLSKAGFCLRGGFHCAFQTHKKIGTEDTGTIRFSPSIFTKKSDVSNFILCINNLF